MSKRTDYSKVSLKAKSPKSIRYNVKDFEAAVSLSGRTTVQSLWDYLVAKYLVDMGVRQVAPFFETPLPKSTLEHTADRIYEPPSPIGVDEMPMWTPKPKTEAEKAAEKAKAEQVAAKELERLKEIQEYKERIKGKKK